MAGRWTSAQARTTSSNAVSKRSSNCGDTTYGFSLRRVLNVSSKCTPPSAPPCCPASFCVCTISPPCEVCGDGFPWRGGRPCGAGVPVVVDEVLRARSGRGDPSRRFYTEVACGPGAEVGSCHERVRARGSGDHLHPGPLRPRTRSRERRGLVGSGGEGPRRGAAAARGGERLRRLPDDQLDPGVRPR